MQIHIPQKNRPEAMADVPGVCALPLTRAVVQYRDRHAIDQPGGWIRDIGLAVVLDGRYAARAEVIDLGSGEVRQLDLSGELVVLDWVHEPTLEHLSTLLRDAAGGGERSPLRRFCADVALQVLERTGFGPLTRLTFLRIGFRDVCRDLDLHDGTSVRITLGDRRLVRVHLDYDHHALVFRTPADPTDDLLESALGSAFPGVEIRRIVAVSPSATGGYLLRLPLPLDLDEVRSTMQTIREGLFALIARFEPGRHRALREMMTTFGARETLARIRARPHGLVTRPLERVPAALPPHAPSPSPSAPSEGTVH